MTSITISNKALAGVFARAIRDTDTKAEMRVLGGLHLEARDGVLSVTATDITGAAQYKVEGRGRGNMAGVLLDPRKILKWLRAVKAAINVKITVLDGQFIFTRKGRTLQAPTIPAAEFPSEVLKWFGKRSRAIGAITDIQRWGPLLLATCSTDETRPYLACVHVEKGYVTSTDGHRCNRLNMIGTLTANAACAIPREAWERLVRDCKARKVNRPKLKMIGKTRAKQYLRVEYGNCVRIIKDNGAEAPPWSAIFPRTLDFKFVPEDPSALVEVLNEIKSLASEHARVAKFAVNGAGFKVSFEDPGGPKFEARVGGKIRRTKGTEDPFCGFNIHYLLEGLAAFEKPRLCPDSTLGPMIINEKDNPLTHLLMPIRV